MIFGFAFCANNRARLTLCFHSALRTGCILVHSSQPRTDDYHLAALPVQIGFPQDPRLSTGHIFFEPSPDMTTKNSDWAHVINRFFNLLTRRLGCALIDVQT